MTNAQSSLNYKRPKRGLLRKLRWSLGFDPLPKRARIEQLRDEIDAWKLLVRQLESMGSVLITPSVNLLDSNRYNRADIVMSSKGEVFKNRYGPTGVITQPSRVVK